jgi:hypothetical protein
MTAASTPVLIAGTPESGKTTFIAAFWHVVSNARQSRFSVYDFAGDREYLNQLERSWVAVTQLPRTRRGQHVQVSMNIEDRSTGRRFQLWLPDLSGEDFLKAFAKREWSEGLDEFVASMAGVLLFVNPEHVLRTTPLSEVMALANAAGEEQAVQDGEGQNYGKPWDAEESPTATVLVDLLDTITHRRGPTEQPIRVALMVSAWDTMAALGMAPEEWVRRDLSLLYQYLLTNGDRYRCKVYGVSALGGDVTNTDVQSRLRNLIDPLDRISVVGDGVTNDLTVPVAWASGAYSP